jgi:molybdate transport system substrate-binding protein
MRSRAIAAGVALWCAGCARPPAAPERPRSARAPLAIAAAADLKFALDELAAGFRRAHAGIDLRPTYGSSGNFYAQIRAGAPFDVFLSADVDYPSRLAQDKIGAPNTLFIYGFGRLVVWVPADSKLDPATALRQPSLGRVAIANPAHAPYGRAAEAALRGLGLYDALQAKLVLGENVAQAFEFVESGAADAGIVALSLALAPSARGRYWEIPPSAYPRIEQAGLILRDSPAARDFRAFLLSGPARDTLERFGFRPPEEH